jgi:hypothetical protein
MKSLFLRAIVIAACSAPLAACTANVHDNTLNVENPQVEMTANTDVTNIHPGGSVPLTIKADNVFPVAPNETPPAKHANDAVFFKIFLDDVSSQELVVTASLEVSVTIPTTTPPGDHKLICKTFQHDGAATDSESTVDIKVTASVTTTTPATGM